MILSIVLKIFSKDTKTNIGLEEDSIGRLTAERKLTWAAHSLRISDGRS